MARRDQTVPVYEAFRRFLDECVLRDRSLLWPAERVWTLENVSEVKRRMVDAPIEGADRGFMDKLQEQMAGADPEHWMIIGDLFFAFSLPSTSLKLHTKQRYVQWVVDHGGLEEPPYEEETWKAQDAGFVKTGQQYNRKYGQFWLLILLAEHVKRLDDPEEAVASPSRLQEVLDTLLEGIEYGKDRAYDMRHAILYMVFPDKYERIISTQDKKNIVKYYRDLLEGPAPDDLPHLDESIRRVRRVLEEQHDGEEPFDFYDDTNREWRTGRPRQGGDSGHISVDQSEAPAEVVFVLSTLARTRNVILHGPPGTGKTYVAGQAAEQLVHAQAKAEPTRSALLMEIIEDLSFYDLLALTLYRLGPRSSHPVSDVLDHELVRARYRIRPVQNPRANVWGSLQTHADPGSETVSVTRRLAPYLFGKEETGGRWFLTEEGHGYVEEELSAQLSRLEGEEQTTPATERFVEWTTFHQSYAYEDFVEGLRPVQSEEDPGGISYQVLPGVLRRICARAAADPSNKYVLVIDEINRGNIAKILGELMTLLEDDKRAGNPNELAVTLPYSGERFSVPANLHVIGTMNTADRSIALLDVALRRRFAFVEVMPNPSLLDGAVVESEGTVVDLGDLLRTLNRGIVRSIDRDHQIGHSYLLSVAGADDDDRVAMLEFTWNNQILPLLEEYFYSQREKLAELLPPFDANKETDPPTDPSDAVEFDLGRKSGDELVYALSELVDTEEEQ